MTNKEDENKEEEAIAVLHSQAYMRGWRDGYDFAKACEFPEDNKCT